MNYNIQKEKWKDVVGYEGIYQVSDKGRVKSLDRVGGSNRNFKGKLLKPGPKGEGYYSVVLCKDNGKKAFYLHRLVAHAFVPNTNNESEIDHIDGEKDNNCASNLEWVSRKENIVRSWDMGKREYQRKIAVTTGEGRAKSVVQIDVEGNEVRTFKSLTEAGKKVGIFPNNISMCCNGKIKTAGGYHWEFE